MDFQFRYPLVGRAIEGGCTCNTVLAIPSCFVGCTSETPKAIPLSAQPKTRHGTTLPHVEGVLCSLIRAT